MQTHRLQPNQHLLSKGRQLTPHTSRPPVFLAPQERRPPVFLAPQERRPPVSRAPQERNHRDEHSRTLIIITTITVYKRSEFVLHALFFSSRRTKQFLWRALIFLFR